MRTLQSSLLACTLVMAAALAAAEPAPVSGEEPIVGGRCEGCEAVFQGLPEELAPEARIAPVDEPGRPLIIEGRVRFPDGSPAPGIVVYAYHTNAQGIYPRSEESLGRAASRHGRLRAWTRTDEDGRYRFRSIRPGGYPGSNNPEHVHLHVIEPGRCTYYVDSIHFADDPRLAGRLEEHAEGGRGGSGLTHPRQNAEGVWRVERDIVLGQEIPGHPGFPGEEDGER